MAIFALAWELLARAVGSLLLPGFLATMAALVRLLATPALWQALWISNQAMLLGFVLAAAVGVPLGLWMGRWRAAEDWANPYLSILLVIPVSALIPIVIMATGLGLATRVLVVFAFVFVTIVLNVRAGVRMIDPAWIEMTHAFGATELQLWRKILLPGALPAILTGLRLGSIRAVSGMITMELLLIAVGMGRMILDFQGEFDAPSLYAAVIVVIAEAVLLAHVWHWTERRATPWSEAAELAVADD